MMVNIIRIEHVRCDDYEGDTYVIVPDGKSEEDIENDLDTARSLLLADAAKLKDDYPQPVNTYKNIHTIDGGYPDNFTIGEAKQHIKEVRAQLDAYEAKKRLANRGFASYLTGLGYKVLGALAAHHTVYWGHQHGVSITLDISETDTHIRKLLRP